MHFYGGPLLRHAHVKQNDIPTYTLLKNVKWLDKIRSKDEIPSTVSFDRVDNWLDIASHSLFRGLSTKADQIYREIRDIRERLKQNTSRLQDAEPDENMPDHIRKIGLLNRDRMVKHLYSVTDKIVIPSQTDYKTVLSFYRETRLVAK